MPDDVSVSGLPTQTGNLTETERILVIALLAVLSLLIVLLITLIAITCRKNMKTENSSYHRSITRVSMGRPVLTGNKPRLSVSRLNSRYSDADFSATPGTVVSRPVSHNPVYFRNQTFQEDCFNQPEPSVNSDVIDNETDMFYQSPRNSPNQRAKFF